MLKQLRELANKTARSTGRLFNGATLAVWCRRCVNDAMATNSSSSLHPSALT
ncbi:MAG: hypothetical protein QOE55_743 [Acidobacteriaceae bacterium]|jgi:hypothetical protein|nr:hypothetical protein [Acidobacteriaceae bacterium]